MTARIVVRTILPDLWPAKLTSRTCSAVSPTNKINWIIRMVWDQRQHTWNNLELNDTAGSSAHHACVVTRVSVGRSRNVKSGLGTINQQVGSHTEKILDFRTNSQTMPSWLKKRSMYFDSKSPSIAWRLSG